MHCECICQPAFWTVTVLYYTLQHGKGRATGTEFQGVCHSCPLGTVSKQISCQEPSFVQRERPTSLLSVSLQHYGLDVPVLRWFLSYVWGAGLLIGEQGASEDFYLFIYLFIVQFQVTFKSAWCTYWAALIWRSEASQCQTDLTGLCSIPVKRLDLSRNLGMENGCV